MTGRPKDGESEPEPGSREDLIPEIDPRDPSEEVEDDGEVPGGGNFA